MGALDIGIDLGTTKVIIYKSDEGELLREPAVVAVNTQDESLIAAGKDALAMLGRTPGYIRAVYPMEKADEAFKALANNDGSLKKVLIEISK